MATMALLPWVEEWVCVTQGIACGCPGSGRPISLHEKPALSHQQLADSLQGHSFIDFM